jgi:hypothetical protein
MSAVGLARRQKQTAAAVREVLQQQAAVAAAMATVVLLMQQTTHWCLTQQSTCIERCATVLCVWGGGDEDMGAGEKRRAEGLRRTYQKPLAGHHYTQYLWHVVHSSSMSHAVVALQRTGTVCCHYTAAHTLHQQPLVNVEVYRLVTYTVMPWPHSKHQATPKAPCRVWDDLACTDCGVLIATAGAANPAGACRAAVTPCCFKATAAPLGAGAAAASAMRPPVC